LFRSVRREFGPVNTYQQPAIPQPLEDVPGGRLRRLGSGLLPEAGGIDGDGMDADSDDPAAPPDDPASEVDPSALERPARQEEVLRPGGGLEADHVGPEHARKKGLTDGLRKGAPAG